MSEKVELIIELPKTTYQEIIENRDTSNTNIYTAIQNGTLLNNIKAEIADLPDHMFEVYKLKSRVLYILDNVGKESEDT